MDTGLLRSFGVWARSGLIGEVAGRVAAVLAPGSVQRVEQPGAVAALEQAVAAAGGGEAGRAVVADQVAYTWFNRIVALRFMDANGYTGVGVVSPRAGTTVGQPEILAEAKRGVFDADVVSARTQQVVTSLLDGNRNSTDAQGEAYGLLLADYCRYWNKAMPFMFEPEGDFTELLMPANLLADDSVLNRAVSVLTPEVCADVEVIGWLYQFYISERKDEVFAGFKKNIKAGPAEIPAATQLFTPHWIVRYLVENSLGRLWMLNHPDSRLVEQMDYYIPPVDEETDFLTISTPEDIKIIDPACGSGHMLTYAFDLLYAIYEEQGYAPSEIPTLILTHNLYGTEIDPRAGTLAAFALTMKARAKQRTHLTNNTQPRICVIEPVSFTDDELDYLLTAHGDRQAEEAYWNQFQHADLLGSLIQPDPELTTQLAEHLTTLDNAGDLIASDINQRAHQVITQAQYLQSNYTIAIANPPYMGMRKMTVALARFISSRYRLGQQDTYAAFVERAVSLVCPKGMVAMVTMQSWMFLSTFEGLRRWILTECPPDAVAHLGSGAFDSIGGEVVTTAAFVLSRHRCGKATAVYTDATAGEDEETKAMIVRGAGWGSTGTYRINAGSLLDLPGAVIGYWATEELISAYEGLPSLSEVADVRQGLSTANDSRFLRQWYEVSLRRTSIPAPSATSCRARARWVPCNKGGGPRRWYGNQDFVIDWEHDGEVLRDPRTGGTIRNANYYFRESVSWSNIGGSPAFRYFPEGFIFNAKGMSVFPRGESSVYELLGYLNSNSARAALRLVAPINSIEVGHVAAVPVPTDFGDVSGVREAVAIAKQDWDDQELSWGFQRSPLLTTSGADLRTSISIYRQQAHTTTQRLHEIELANSRRHAQATHIQESSSGIDIADIALFANERFRYKAVSSDKRERQALADIVRDLVSYAVGCMFGRYSLDQPGLVLADQGATVQDYLAKVPQPTFMPDADNVLPIVDGDWFEDDIVARFRQFLREAFGEEHFEETLRFVTESLGVKNIRDYFVKSFHKDHVQRYKKRPIYWLFSSPKGSFNALIYMHRYTPSTVSTVLNEYLREFQAKLKASLDHAERSNNAKEADRLRKVLVELETYEHDVLYPLATQQITIDLDDGVKANYPKLGPALKKIPGLEKNE